MSKVKSVRESGDAKNAANFVLLISGCRSMGSDYNPSVKALALDKLDAKQLDAETAMRLLKTSVVNFNTATNNRKDAFVGLKALGSRVVLLLETTGASEETLKDAGAITRKMNGRRAKAVKQEQPVEGSEVMPTDKRISVSQLSFDNQVDHFEKLLALVSNEAGYTPNETELTVTGLQTYLDSLVQHNRAVMVAHMDVKKARSDRDVALYDAETGLVKIGKSVKKYVAAALGKNSAAYARIKDISLKSKRVRK